MADDDFERQASPGKKHEDEDDYSDDDFLDPAQTENTDETQKKEGLAHLQIIHEHVNESFDKSQAEIANFLKTATEKDMEIIRESLSNFAEVSKHYTNFAPAAKRAEEDEYIEEDFEEEIPEDNCEENEDEELRFEKVNDKLNPSAVSKKGRPVSAVYDLSQFKTGSNQNIQSQRQLAPAGSALVLSQPTAAVELNKQPPSTVKKAHGSKFSIDVGKQEQGFRTNRPSEDRSRAGNLAPVQVHHKPNFNASGKPFTRPFSELNPGKRQHKASATTAMNVVGFSGGPNYQSQHHMTVPERDADNIEASYGQQSQMSRLSQKDVELQMIMQAIASLGDSQRQDLLAVLRDKSATSNLAGALSATLDPSRANSRFGASQASTPLSLGTSSMVTHKASGFGQSTAPTTERSRNEVKIRVLSTHGDPHLCGLTEIELFDEQARKVVVLPQNVIVRNTGRTAGQLQMSTKALVNGQKLTNDHRNMWLGSLPQPQNPRVYLEIILYYARDTKLSAVKIWNYNKSVRDSTKGAREIQLFVNDELKFEGAVKMGRGQTREDYSQLIPLEHAAAGIPFAEAEPKIEVSAGDISFSANNKVGGVTVKPALVLEEQQQSTNIRNIDVIRKRTQNELSKSRSRSPINDFGKPVWLQPSKDLQNSISSRELPLPQVSAGIDFVHQSLKSSVSKERLNRRQQEQLEKSQERRINFFQPTIVANLSKDEIKASKVQEAFQASEMVKAVGASSIPVADTLFQAQLIEESLESFDLFKVTNRGRINHDQTPFPKGALESEQKTKQTLKGEKQFDEILSHQSADKHSQTKSSFKAPKVAKSPFPEDFSVPSPAMSHKKSVSRSSIKREKEKFEIDAMAGASNPELVRKLKEEEDLLNDVEVAIKNPNDDTFEVELKRLEQQVAQPRLDIKPKLDPFQAKLHEFTQPFVIPNLPQGKQLEINILQTWGDANYLGLTGIEIFDLEGHLVPINGERDISASPCDINLLMGYGTDPRTVDKLVDGFNFTNDDFHAWLTPFTQGEDHTISIRLPAVKQISMLRFWNYNKSRIHSFRGARLLTCHLDGHLIFRGEIAKAPGNTKDPAQCCEIVLFTENEAILSRIDENDWLNSIQLTSSEPQNTEADTDQAILEQNRPMTATKRFTEEEVLALQRGIAGQIPMSLLDERPQTKAIRRDPKSQTNQPFVGAAGGSAETEWQEDPTGDPLPDFKPKLVTKKERKRVSGGVKGRVIELNITESWGDLFYVGLNGIEVYDSNSSIVSLDIKNIDANPRDMNSIPGHRQDHRTLDKLINGVNNTSDDRNMWLIPFNAGEDHKITIDLGRMVNIGSLKFYNYNKSAEDSLRGAKTVIIKVDGKLMSSSKGVTLRKAPGFTLPEDPLMSNDIGQTIGLPFADGWKTNFITPLQNQLTNTALKLGIQQEYEPIAMPIGFTFRINLYSTHGDHFYIGLNGIEVYDQVGSLISITPHQEVMVNPPGINRLPGMSNDLRTLDKLFNGNNQSYNESNMWLAPFKFTRSAAAANSSSQNGDKREPNFISIFFDQPQAISALRLWNYAKTPERGVHEFELVVDDKPIFRGFAKKAPLQGSGHKMVPTTVVFTSEKYLINRFASEINYDATKQQEVLLINEKKQVNQGQVKQRPNEKFVFNEKERPQTKYGGGFL